MTARYLITTADENTWPADTPVLFLGEWCRLYNRRYAWEKLDAEVVPYHWDDRKKLYGDYQYLQELYEELLGELADKLNEIHDVKHSPRYWRILVGPWLGYFLQMVFDRWEMIENAVNHYMIAGIRVLGTTLEQVVSKDMNHFNQLYVEDLWNEAIYAELLTDFTNVPIEKAFPVARQNLHLPLTSASDRRTLTLLKKVRSNLLHIVNGLSRYFVREDEAFFMTSYLPRRQDLLLQWKLGQMPKLWRSPITPRFFYDRNMRNWNLSVTKEKNFKTIARSMIPKHIPTLYLEGYNELQGIIKSLPWPKRPRLIFTSNSYSSDDVFKARAAEKIEAGALLVVGQHGGNYGIGRWEFTEDHQCAISDGWLSWGWDDEKRPQIKPVGNLKIIGNNIGWDPEGHALMVEMTMPRYSYRMYSVPVAGQWLDYFNDQCRFVDALPDDIRRSLLVRLYMQDYGWGQSARWKDRFPDVCLDDGQTPIVPLIKKSRLYISTYNATTFLESLAMNIPTVMFWNPKHWELRDSAVPYFKRLKAVGIFHESPESAAQQTTLVWDNVAVWWNSESVQTVRNEFCYRYSRVPERPLKVLKQVLHQISHSAIE